DWDDFEIESFGIAVFTAFIEDGHLAALQLYHVGIAGIARIDNITAVPGGSVIGAPADGHVGPCGCRRVGEEQRAADGEDTALAFGIELGGSYCRGGPGE